MTGKIGSFRKMPLRHVKIAGKPTTVALESEFWDAIDRLAAARGMNWQEWAADCIDLSQSGRASRMRVAVLRASAA